MARVLIVRFVALAVVVFRVKILALMRLPDAILAIERFAVIALSVRILAVTMFPETILADV